MAEVVLTNSETKEKKKFKTFDKSVEFVERAEEPNKWV